MAEPSSSRWLPVLVGWLACTILWEWVPEAGVVPPRACALSPDFTPDGPWVLTPSIRELRRLPGIGSKRARLLAERIRAEGVDPRRPGAQSWLLALPGIGPVSARAVLDWAGDRYPLAQDEAVHFQAAIWPVPNPNP